MLANSRILYFGLKPLQVHCISILNDIIDDPCMHDPKYECGKKRKRFARIIAALTRAVSSTPQLFTKSWRLSQGLTQKRNSAGVLTDAPDYTFLDGRPTPLLHKQKLRLEKHREFASKIVELNSELDFAIQRQQQMLSAKDEERQKIIANRLKPKGHRLNKKDKSA